MDGSAEIHSIKFLICSFTSTSGSVHFHLFHVFTFTRASSETYKRDGKVLCELIICYTGRCLVQELALRKQYPQQDTLHKFAYLFFGHGTYFVLAGGGAEVRTVSALQDEARTGQVLRCVRPLEAHRR